MMWSNPITGKQRESPDDVRLSFELLLMAMNDMIDLRQYIWDEQVASVKIVMLEELISVMDKDTSNFAAKFDPDGSCTRAEIVCLSFMPTRAPTQHRVTASKRRGATELVGDNGFAKGTFRARPSGHL
jgi:hypothetical protein